MNLFSLQTEKRAAEINQLSRINNSKNHPIIISKFLVDDFSTVNHVK